MDGRDSGLQALQKVGAPVNRDSKDGDDVPDGDL